MKPHIPQYIVPVDGHEYELVDPEQEFGAKVLPWLGAGLVVLGLGYLVHYGIKHNWITPAMQMAGSGLLSAIFAALGLWLARGENGTRFFGNLLIGLGSCGLYLTAVGGFTSWHLNSSETMLGAFVGLSLLNLLYGFWRALPPFVLIGMIGGSIASGILAAGNRPEMSLVILGLVGIPSIASLAMRREPYWIGPTWLVGFISMATWSESHHGYPMGIWLLCALAAHAWGMYRSDKAMDPITAPIATGITLMGMHAYMPGLWVWTSYVAALGVLIMGVGSLVSARGRAALMLTGGVCVAFIAPLSLTLEWLVLIYALLAPAWLAATMRLHRAVFCAGTPLLGVALFGGLALGNTSFPTLANLYEVSLDLLLICQMASVIACAILATLRDGKRAEAEVGLMAVRATAVIIVALLAWRLSGEGEGASRYEGTLSLVLTSIAAFVVGQWGRFVEVRITGLVLLVAAIGKLLMFDLTNMDPGLKVLALVGVGAVSLAISYAIYIKPRAIHR